MQDGIYRVLFLSRRNSARSVMAEAILNKIGKGRFKAFSAAVDPAPVIEPTVLQLLRNEDYPIEDINLGISGILRMLGRPTWILSSPSVIPPPAKRFRNGRACRSPGIGAVLTRSLSKTRLGNASRPLCRS